MSLIEKVALDLLSFLRYRQGASTIFSNGYEDHSQMDSEVGAFNPDLHDPYRQAPFSNQNSASLSMGGYQQPNY